MVKGSAENPRVAGSSPAQSTTFLCLNDFFCLTWVQIRKFTNFEGQKHQDSPELTIPDYGHLSSYLMENILAYTNATHRTTLKMPFFYSKTKIF